MLSSVVPDLKTIFSLDDDENDSLLLKAALKAVGFKGIVEFASDVQDAIELLGRPDRKSVPDLVLVDINMPRQNGFECLKWLRSNESLRCIPVAMFTTSSHPEEIAKAYEFGADWYLVKPLTYDELLDLARALGDCVEIPEEASSRLEAHPAYRSRPGR